MSSVNDLLLSFDHWNPRYAAARDNKGVFKYSRCVCVCVCVCLCVCACMCVCQCALPGCVLKIKSAKSSKHPSVPGLSLARTRS